MIKLLPTEYLSTILEKSKVLPEGTVRDWKGKKYQKKSGKWIPQKKGVTKKGDSLLSLEQKQTVSKLGVDVKEYNNNSVLATDKKGNRYRIEKNGKWKQTTSTAGESKTNLQIGKKSTQKKDTIILLGDESSDEDVARFLKKIGVKLHEDAYGTNNYIQYKDKKIKLKDPDKIYDSVGYLKKKLQDLGFHVKTNSFGDLKIDR